MIIIIVTRVITSAGFKLEHVIIVLDREEMLPMDNDYQYQYQPDP